MRLETALFLGNLGATLAMTGLIWFVQIVHYPLFARVGAAEFIGYEQAHQRLTSLVVAPLMLVELATAIALAVWLRPADFPTVLAWMGLILVGVVWLSTFLLQVPQHEALGSGFEINAHGFLVVSNWIRTIAWSARAVLLLWVVGRMMELSP
jgi:hypothetical protein